MKSQFSVFLTTAIVSTLFFAQQSQAQSQSPDSKSPEMSSGKNGCKSHAAPEKNSCKGKLDQKKKKKKGDKNSCKNGCGEATEGLKKQEEEKTQPQEAAK